MKRKSFSNTHSYPLNCGPSPSPGTLILATKAVTSFDNCDPGLE